MHANDLVGQDERPAVGMKRAGAMSSSVRSLVTFLETEDIVVRVDG